MVPLELIAHNLFKIAHAWVLKQSLWNGHKIEDNIPDFYKREGGSTSKEISHIIMSKSDYEGRV